MNLLLVTVIKHYDKNLFRQTIRSVLEQTLQQNFKYVIVGLEESQLAQSMSSHYPHISFHRSNANSTQQALNEVLNKFSTDIIAHLPSGDLLYSNALRHIKWAFEANPEIGAVYGSFSEIDQANNLVIENHPRSKMIKEQFSEEGQLALKKRFLKQNICGPFAVFNTKALLGVGGFPEDSRYYPSTYATIGTILQRYKVVKVDELLYKLRLPHRDKENRLYYQQVFKAKFKL